MFEKIQSLFTKPIQKPIQQPIIKAQNSSRATDFTPSASFDMKEPPPLTMTEQLKTYRSWVFAAVSMKAAAVASMELTLFKKTRGDIEIVEEHPVLDLLDKVNERMTFYGLMNYSSIIRNLSGETYWLMIFNNKGEPVEIYPWIRPDYITVIPSKDRDEFIKGYVYTVPGSQEEIPLNTEEIIQFLDVNPINPYRGQSRVAATAFAIETDKKASAWNWRFYKNNATPRGILKIQNRFDEAQYKQLKASWDAGHQGESNSNKVAIIFTGSAGTDADFMEVGMSTKDMDFLKQREYSRDEILSIFGVPFSLLNPGTNVNRATVEAAQVNFLTNTVRPEMREWTEELNEFLLPLYNDSEGLFFDFTDPVPENRELSLKAYDSGLNLGWLTVDEVRAKEGLPPLTEKEKEAQDSNVPEGDDNSEDKPIEEDEDAPPEDEGEQEGDGEEAEVEKTLKRRKFNVRVKSSTPKSKIESIVDKATSVELKRILEKQLKDKAPKKKKKVITKRIKTSQNEKIFQKSINEEEKFLQKFYDENFLDEVIKTEKEIQAYLVKKYEKAPSEIVNGVLVFKQNDRLRKEMEKWIDKKMSKLLKDFTGEKMKELHNNSEVIAKQAVKDISRASKGFVSNIAMFIKGYLSNIKAFIFNEGRRIKEKITDNLLQGVMVSLAIQQARETSLNKNTLKLSAISHPRGLYRKTIEDAADKDGISFFKMLAPLAVIPTLSKTGMTMAALYMIKTKDEWNKHIDPNNNTNVVGGLGLHHGSQDYYLPEGFESLKEEKEISKEQRRELNGKSIKPIKSLDKKQIESYKKEIEEVKGEIEKNFKKKTKELEKEYLKKEKETTEGTSKKVSVIESKCKKLEEEKEELQKEDNKIKQKEEKLESLISEFENE